MMMEPDRAGVLVEYGPTAQLFTNPKDKRTEDYITGRFRIIAKRRINMETRTAFHKKLREIQDDILAMGSMVSKAMLTFYRSAEEPRPGSGTADNCG